MHERNSLQKGTSYRMDTFFSIYLYLQTVCLFLTFQMEPISCQRWATQVLWYFEFIIFLAISVQVINEWCFCQDYSISLLKKVLRQIEVIKTSRSGIPNFESHHIEANELQAAVAQYFQFRGTGKVCTLTYPMWLFCCFTL